MYNMYNVYIKHQGKTKHQDGDQIPALFQTALLGPTCLLGLCLVQGGAFLPVGSRGLMRRFPKMVPNMDDLYWFIIENPTKMDDEQGYPYFRKPPNIAWLSFKQYFFLPGLLRGFAPPHCPHLLAGKGCQLSVTWNEKVKSKKQDWVVPNGWNTVSIILWSPAIISIINQKGGWTVELRERMSSPWNWPYWWLANSKTQDVSSNVRYSWRSCDIRITACSTNKCRYIWMRGI